MDAANSTIKRRPGRPKKVLTEEEEKQRLEKKREYDRQRQSKRYQQKKAERLQAGAPTIYPEEELRVRSLQKQQRYAEDEAYRNYMKEKSREYQRKKREELKAAEQKTTKKPGRPRKHLIQTVPTGTEE